MGRVRLARHMGNRDSKIGWTITRSPVRLPNKKTAHPLKNVRRSGDLFLMIFSDLAEGKGVEPSTACAATDFESAS